MTAQPKNLAASVHQRLLNLSQQRNDDFYDLWTLSRLFAFDGTVLTQAIEATFTRRNTPIPAETPTALTVVFAENQMKITQWKTFLRRNRLDVDGASFADIITELSRFLLPPIQALAGSIPFSHHWTTGAKWK